MLLLRFSLTLCPASLDICMKILEDLELVTTKDTNLQNNAYKTVDTAKRNKSYKKLLLEKVMIELAHTFIAIALIGITIHFLDKTF